MARKAPAIKYQEKAETVGELIQALHGFHPAEKVYGPELGGISVTRLIHGGALISGTRAGKPPKA